VTLPPTPQPVDSSSAAPSGAPSINPSGAVVPASGCSGTAENRDFYAAAAAAVDWSVYCPVLPTGWFVESGSWRLANGGHLQVSYKGPNGARLMVQEGTYCTAGVSACSPHDHDIGPAAYGDMAGDLVDLGPDEPGDGYAVYVNPGSDPPSWSITGTNIDQAAFTAIAAALLHIQP
jgi:hypothetical protein